MGGLREPVQDGEAATKKYVDDVANQFIDENDNIAFGRDIDMENKKIFSLAEPLQDSEPATKKYVDDLQTQHVDLKGNIKFGRNINVDNKRIFSLKEPKKDNEAANKKYVDDNITKRLQEEKDNFLPQDPATKHYVDEAIKGLAGGDVIVSKEGVFIKENGHYRATASIDMDNQKMENLPVPKENGDATNKKYVDDMVKNLTLEKALLKENGGYNVANAYINMNFNNIRNVGYPQNSEDAVPKSFVDDTTNSLKEKVEKMKPIVTASASFHGDLIKGNYQFTWGADSIESHLKKHNVFNGFLIPADGRIKKFLVLNTGLKLNTDLKEELVDIIAEKGLNNPIPLFTLVLIKKNKEPVDAGTLNFMFTKYPDVGVEIDVETLTDYVFELNKPFDETGILVNAKDVINIRTEFSSILVGKHRTVMTTLNYDLKYLETEFFTYLATVLIELDPLDD